MSGKVASNVVLAFIFGLATTGCAPGTSQGLRESVPAHVAKVDMNYQHVYKTMLDRMRACYEAGLITAQKRVDANLYPDLGEGEIRVALVGGLGTDVYQVMDVTEIEDGTRIESWYSGGRSPDLFEQQVAWVTERTRDCAR